MLKSHQVITIPRRLENTHFHCYEERIHFFPPLFLLDAKQEQTLPATLFYFRDCVGPGMGCKIEELVYSEDFIWMCMPTFWNWHKGAMS